MRETRTLLTWSNFHQTFQALEASDWFLPCGCTVYLGTLDYAEPVQPRRVRSILRLDRPLSLICETYFCSYRHTPVRNAWRTTAPLSVTKR